MSNTVHHTHRRAMRTVTPVSRAGRVGAGAAMAAAMLLGGAAAATAEPQAEAPRADAGAAVLTPVVAPAVGIPAAGGSDDSATAAAFAPAAGTDFSVEVGPTAEEIAAAEREAAEQEAAEQEAVEQAAQEQPEEEQQSESADSEEQTETRGDDSSETSSRSGERSQREDDSEGEQQESSSGGSESGSEEKEESAPAPSSAGKGSSILATARSGIGTPYVYGGTSPSGWDCSGFVQWVYAQHGINLPRGAGDQAAAGTVIPRSEARPGDLVYKPGHIGIYAGGNKFVDAGNSRVDTTERNIYAGSWTFIRIG